MKCGAYQEQLRRGPQGGRIGRQFLPNMKLGSVFNARNERHNSRGLLLRILEIFLQKFKLRLGTKPHVGK